MSNLFLRKRSALSDHSIFSAVQQQSTKTRIPNITPIPTRKGLDRDHSNFFSKDTFYPKELKAPLLREAT